MSRTFSMPELAESVVEGEIVQWLVAEGEPVALDQPLLEVMTDKVTVEIPSPFEGVLVERLASEGDVVQVGGPLARFDGPEGATVAGEVASEVAGEAAGEAGGVTGSEVADASAAPARSEARAEDDGASLTLFTASAPADEGPLPTVRKAGARDRRPPPPRPSASAPGPATATAGAAAGGAAAEGATARGPWGRPLAVPAARKRARELGVPLDALVGSGPQGRIRVEDVEHGAAAAPAAAGAGGRALPPYPGTPLAPEPEGPATTRVPLRGMRRTISKQLLDGHLSTVQTLAVEEADVARLVALRARLKDRAAARGVKLTYLPFVLKALTRSLAAYPAMNARWDEDAGDIVRYRDAHLGVAVDTDQGLIVPVIHHASRRSLLDLGAEAARLAEAARAGRLAPDDMRGGTFSVTNIGSVGALLSMPVLNAPEAGILGVHRIKKRPVVLDDDSIVPRPMLYLSLTFDHRLIDGAEATRFLTHLVAGLEDPEPMLMGEDGLEDLLLDA
jgi:pyruvate dehydrogenase E2 component (dihydrolipoamide acetyltransferase)